MRDYVGAGLVVAAWCVGPGEIWWGGCSPSKIGVRRLFRRSGRDDGKAAEVPSATNHGCDVMQVVPLSMERAAYLIAFEMGFSPMSESISGQYSELCSRWQGGLLSGGQEQWRFASHGRGN